MTFTLGRPRGDSHETSGLGSGFDHKSFARKRREICVVRTSFIRLSEGWRNEVEINPTCGRAFLMISRAIVGFAPFRPQSRSLLAFFCARTNSFWKNFPIARKLRQSKIFRAENEMESSLKRYSRYSLTFSFDIVGGCLVVDSHAIKINYWKIISRHANCAKNFEPIETSICPIWTRPASAFVALFRFSVVERAQDKKVKLVVKARASVSEP